MSETLVAITAAEMIPPTSSYPTPDMRGNCQVLDFDAAADETCYAFKQMPYAYNGGDLTVDVVYMMSSATANEVVLCVAFERIGEGQQDLDADGFAAIQTVTDTVPGTSGQTGVASIAFTNAQADAVAAGEFFGLKFYRDADHADDDAAGDLELVSIHIKQA